ncbi:MAG: histidine phosphatase family protein [bacterium]|nr:histidine phosphatase family protein [bacterium]
MIEAIKKHSADSKLALIIRHADRDKIPAGSFGNEVLLNAIGINNSIRFGKELMQHKINCIYTSPVERCVQTAHYLKDGYKKEIPFHTTKALGDPGLHIADDKLAGEFFLKYTFDEMYRRFMLGETIPGVPSAQDFETKMTEFIKQNTIEDGLTIFITHDSLIAFYHYCLNKVVYTKENWVNYLSGIILKVE